MSYKLVVKPDLIHCDLTGILTDDDLRKLATEADAIEADFDQVPHRITDMTGVTVMEVGYPQVRAFAVHRRTLQFPNTYRSAIVASSKVQYGIARMFQSLNDNPWITIQIFEDRPAAMKWLDEVEAGT